MGWRNWTFCWHRWDFRWLIVRRSFSIWVWMWSWRCRISLINSCLSMVSQSSNILAFWGYMVTTLRSQHQMWFVGVTALLESFVETKSKTPAAEQFWDAYSDLSSKNIDQLRKGIQNVIEIQRVIPRHWLKQCRIARQVWVKGDSEGLLHLADSGDLTRGLLDKLDIQVFLGWIGK